MNLQKGNKMKDIFKSCSVIDYRLSVSEKHEKVTPKSFRFHINQNIVDDYEMELCTGDYYETSGYFLLNVTEINQETADYCDLYDEFESDRFKIMMVGEFSDGQIEERNKDHYLIFRVEEK